jgi:excisionase family DNA binding protein
VRTWPDPSFEGWHEPASRDARASHRGLEEIAGTGADAIPVEELRAFTVPQAAELLGLSEVYLRVMLKRGDIRSVKAGRRVLVPAAAIRDFLAPPGSAAS